MKKTILTLAILVLIMPFIGIPESWKTVLLVIIGIVLAYAAYHKEIAVFFTPKINHDDVAAEAFANHGSVAEDQQTPHA